jgi:hypothetical protein
MSELTIPTYLEVGQKKTFAGAVDWPGWGRLGRDEAAAVQALVDYGPRYGRILQAAGIPFQPPADASGLTVVERLTGTTTTDFGAPDVAPAGDVAPFGEDDLAQMRPLLAACWQAFDAAVQAADGKDLRTGPRGGGRNLAKIVDHVLQADGAYLRRLAWKHKIDVPADAGWQYLLEEHRRMRPAILEALAAAARGELPGQGPRGGTVWPPRYFIRRSIWHLLDHAWEIEDRIVG